MSRRVFISYDFNDKELAFNIKSFFQAEGGKCQGRPIFVENDVSDKGKNAIDTEIRRVIKSGDTIPI